MSVYQCSYLCACTRPSPAHRDPWGKPVPPAICNNNLSDLGLRHRLVLFKTPHKVQPTHHMGGARAAGG